MIIGIGTDLCDIRRIEKTLERFGDKFTSRVFTETECKKALGKQLPAASFAQSFAAKEACAKALGTGFRNGVFWRDLAVRNKPGGQPFMELSGGAKKRLESLLPPGTVANIQLSQSDEYPMANAVVIIEAVAGQHDT